MSKKEIKKITSKNPEILQDLLEKIIAVGDTSASVLLQALSDPEVPNNVKLSISGTMLKQVMEFLTTNNKTDV